MTAIAIAIAIFLFLVLFIFGVVMVKETMAS